MILIMVTLITAQAVINLIIDWNKEPQFSSKTEIDDDELDAIKRSVETK